MPRRREANARLTRAALVGGGLELADRDGLANVSINRLVAEVQMSKGTFFHHFENRETYLLALHDTFHLPIFASIQAAITGMEPGRDRLLGGTFVYLEGSLANIGARAALLELRAEPSIVAAVQERNAIAVTFCEPDFAALGHRNPAISARLWIGMVVEAALLEHAAGDRLIDVRDALADHVGR